MRRVFLGTAALFIACYTPAIAYKQAERSQEKFNLNPFPNSAVIGTAISLAPFFLMASIIICIYLTTWIRYWYQTGGIRVGRIITSEFRMVSLIAWSDIICSVSWAAFLINMTQITADSIKINLYIWSYSGAVFPMTTGMVVMFYMFFTETDIKFCLIRRCCCSCCKERNEVLNWHAEVLKRKKGGWTEILN